MAQIVIGMDESAGAAAALRWAVGEADVHGWSLTAVLAWAYLDQHHAEPGERFDPAYDAADADVALAAALHRAIGAERAATVERQVVCDLAAPALLAASEGAELLVVGARGMGGFRSLLLGSVSEQVVHHATCPVAVVRAEATMAAGEPGPVPAGGRVVVGLDGSEDGRRALAWALAEGRARGATVEVVHAWQPAFVGGDLFGGVPVDSDAQGAAARRLVGTAVEAEDTAGLASPVEQTVVCGTPANVLLDAAKAADLVVLGSRGVGGFAGLLLGSVSQQVARHAACPVVILPAI
jgi:nucleotide-binding universal stress UspA family protein